MLLNKQPVCVNKHQVVSMPRRHTEKDSWVDNADILF